MQGAGIFQPGRIQAGSFARISIVPAKAWMFNQRLKESIMEIKDDAEALRQLFNGMEPGTGDVESIHQAELEPRMSLLLVANPKAALKAMAIPVSDESVVNVTLKNRADRAPVDADADTAALRRVIVIVIHYRNCDSDIIIIATNR
jgi:hypothetical protein